MNTNTATNAVRDVSDITPITLATDAREVALGVYEQLLALLERLEPDDWTKPTDCPEWSVADMVGHLIGAARAAASLREQLRQWRWARRHRSEFGGNELDAVNALQVREHAHLSPPERITTLRALVLRAVAGRMSFTARLVRRVRLPVPEGGSTATGAPTSYTLGHLNEVILSRDVWLHAVDIARAAQQPLAHDQPVDRRVVEDVVAEWAQRHGKPFTLTLTGPAGGRFRHGEDGPCLTLDAIEFCRILSGRAPGEGLLATKVLF